jgi:methionine--tRNA ligase beta chain
VEFKKEDQMEAKKPEMPPVKPEVSYEDFEKIDLRVAKVLAAEAVPKSSKLLKLKIDVGEERTIVAGMGKDYKPEEIVGKNIVVVVNLKPTKLMNIESRGMLLATDTDAGLTLVSCRPRPQNRCQSPVKNVLPYKAVGFFRGTSTGLTYFLTISAVLLTFSFVKRKENWFSSSCPIAVSVSTGKCQSSFLKGPKPFLRVL